MELPLNVLFCAVWCHMHAWLELAVGQERDYECKTATGSERKRIIDNSVGNKEIDRLYGRIKFSLILYVEAIVALPVGWLLDFIVLMIMLSLALCTVHPLFATIPRGRDCIDKIMYLYRRVKVVNADQDHDLVMKGICSGSHARNTDLSPFGYSL
jgi:hypothetical protein